MAIWDQQGNLRCSNTEIYGCEMFKERGRRETTDNAARLRGWKIFEGRAHCPECAKPARRIRVTNIIEQDGLPGIEFPVVGKESKSKSKRSRHIA